MTPEQFKHCRKTILRLDQNQLADVLGLHFRQVHRYERGITPIPPRITYALAWIALHGTRHPWNREERITLAGDAALANVGGLTPAF